MEETLSMDLLNAFGDDAIDIKIEEEDLEFGAPDMFLLQIPVQMRTLILKGFLRVSKRAEVLRKEKEKILILA